MARAALVTGASSGIGRATSVALAQSGWTVFAGVRTDAAAHDLVAAVPHRIEPVLFDVTDVGALASVADNVRERTGGEGLQGVVCNAGIAIGGPLEDVELSEFRRQLEVNLIGAVAVIQATLPLLRIGHGRLVLISSDNGRWAPPFLAPYAASKFALEAIGDALRLELRRTGIRVALVEPGSIRTAIWDKGRERTADYRQTPESREVYGDVAAWASEMIAEGEARAIPPERVVDAVVAALTARRPKTRYIVGNDARVMVALRAVLPALVFDALVARKLPH